MKYEARFFEGGYSSAETPEIANEEKELNGEKYVLLGKIDEDGEAEAVKPSDEVDYEMGWYTCPLYSLTFDGVDDDDPLITHKAGEIAYITK